MTLMLHRAWHRKDEVEREHAKPCADQPPAIARDRRGCHRQRKDLQRPRRPQARDQMVWGLSVAVGPEA